MQRKFQIFTLEKFVFIYQVDFHSIFTPVKIILLETMFTHNKLDPRGTDDSR